MTSIDTVLYTYDQVLGILGSYKDLAASPPQSYQISNLSDEPQEVRGKLNDYCSRYSTMKV